MSLPTNETKIYNFIKQKRPSKIQIIIGQPQKIIENAPKTIAECLAELPPQKNG